MISKSASHELRRRAEEQLALQRDVEDGARRDHELEVHRIELELQNDELRRTRDDVEAARRRFSELFDRAPVGYVVLDVDGMVREANRAATQMLGTSRSQLLDTPFRRFFSGARDQDVFGQFLGRVLTASDEDTGEESCELTRTAAEGATTQLRLLGSPDAGRGARGALVAMDDVTALRRAEHALQLQVRRRDDFLAVLSHELRNPLAPITHALAILDGTEAGTEAARFAKRVLGRQVEQLTRLVNDLLDASRIDRGKIQLERTDVDLELLVRRTIEDHRAEFDAKHVALESVFADGGPYRIRGDAARLAQVVANLLGNAVKFTPAGGRVRVSLEANRDEVKLSVSDNGAGIDAETIAHVFEPFVQGAQTLDRTRGGLGLGLSTAKALVELHGGSIHVRSAGPSAGATIDVRLPLVRETSRREAAPKPKTERRPRRVLVIEDRAVVADTLALLLSLDGHETRTAPDGPAGIELARTFGPETVFCDLGLPGMSGYDVARAFRADPALANVYLVALSGYALPADQERARLAGFDRHVAKPASEATLADVFEKAAVRSVRP